MLFFFLIVAVLMLIIFGITLRLTGFLWEDGLRKRIRIGLVLLDGLMLCSILIGPKYFRDASWSADVIAFFSMAVMAQFFFGILVLTALMLRRVRSMLNARTPVDYERRRLLKHALFYPMISIAAGVYGGEWERKQTVVNRFDIPIADLPKELRGFSVAQISDVHLGMFFSLERLKDLLMQCAEQKPDLLAITGDIFDDAKLTPEAVRIVDSFTDAFPRGIWYCHGNHEHHRGISLVERCLRGTRIHVLVNRAEIVSEGQRPLVFAGADYPMGAHGEAFQEKKRYFTEQAMQGVPENAVCVLLAHHPEFMDDAREYGIPLTLTGHTHGSQIGIFGMPLFPVFKYTRGMVKQGDCYGYVHVGNGSWFPYRFGCPPEIACFRLVEKTI